MIETDAQILAAFNSGPGEPKATVSIANVDATAELLLDLTASYNNSSVQDAKLFDSRYLAIIVRTLTSCWLDVWDLSTNTRIVHYEPGTIAVRYKLHTYTPGTYPTFFDISDSPLNLYYTDGAGNRTLQVNLLISTDYIPIELGTYGDDAWVVYRASETANYFQWWDSSKSAKYGKALFSDIEITHCDLLVVDPPEIVEIGGVGHWKMKAYLATCGEIPGLPTAGLDDEDTVWDTIGQEAVSVREIRFSGSDSGPDISFGQPNHIQINQEWSGINYYNPRWIKHGDVDAIMYMVFDPSDSTTCRIMVLLTNDLISFQAPKMVPIDTEDYNFYVFDTESGWCYFHGSESLDSSDKKLYLINATALTEQPESWTDISSYVERLSFYDNGSPVVNFTCPDTIMSHFVTDGELRSVMVVIDVGYLYQQYIEGEYQNSVSKVRYFTGNVANVIHKRRDRKLEVLVNGQTTRLDRLVVYPSEKFGPGTALLDETQMSMAVYSGALEYVQGGLRPVGTEAVVAVDSIEPAIDGCITAKFALDSWNTEDGTLSYEFIGLVFRALDGNNASCLMYRLTDEKLYLFAGAHNQELIFQPTGGTYIGVGTTGYLWLRLLWYAGLAFSWYSTDGETWTLGPLSIAAEVLGHSGIAMKCTLEPYAK